MDDTEDNRQPSKYAFKYLLLYGINTLIFILKSFFAKLKNRLGESSWANDFKNVFLLKFEFIFQCSCLKGEK